MSSPSPSPSSSDSSSITSITATIASTIVATVTQTITASLDPTPSLAPEPNPTEFVPDTILPHDYYNPEHLCDWTRTASDCRDYEFIRWMLVASSGLHLFVALFGVWLLAYRNRGFNSRIVTELFTRIGTGIRPKPMDCIIFFTTVASFIKVAANLPLVFGVLKSTMWLRVAIEQIYWIFVAFAFCSYFVGLLFSMPITTREGIFAVYQPETAYGTKPLRPIHVLTPTTIQKNAILVIGAVYPTVFGAGLGIASGALHDKGYSEASRVLLLLQYANWVLILWSMAVMFFYYGLKYTFILRANIIIAEAALKAPRAAFGIGNLKSRSPARFLFIQLQITGFGGCAVTVLAGALCMIWVLFRDKILAMENDILPHVMAFFWTCAIALAFFAVMLLIAAQSIRNRRRGLHEPSTTMSHSIAPNSGQKSSHNKPSQHDNIVGVSGMFSDPETRLTQQSSNDLSTLHSMNSAEKASMERYERYEDRYDDTHLANAAAAVGVMNDISMDRRPSTPSAHGPLRPLTIQVNAANASSNIRESVFGGRTAPRDDLSGSTSPPPSGQSGFNMPSFPLASMRPGSRVSNVQQSRPSTSSNTGSNHRLSHASSKHGTNSLPMVPLSPTSPTHLSMQSLQQQTQQQLQMLPPQQRTSTLTRTMVGKGFQPIPENQYGSGSEDRGDLLYSDSLRMMQQQQQQQHASPLQSPTRVKSSRVQPMSSSQQQQQQHQPPQPFHDGRPPSPSPRLSNSTARTNNFQQQQIPLPPVQSSYSTPFMQQQQTPVQYDMDVQLQQQHPLHLVAFKGLSPPPRQVGAPGAHPLPASTPTSPTLIPSSRRALQQQQQQQQQQQDAAQAAAAILGIASVPMPGFMNSSNPPSPLKTPRQPHLEQHQQQQQQQQPQQHQRTLSTSSGTSTSFAAGYDDLNAYQPPVPVPRVGGGVRRSSGNNKESNHHPQQQQQHHHVYQPPALTSGSLVSPSSVSLASSSIGPVPGSPLMSASRGPGGGYASQRNVEYEALQLKEKEQREWEKEQKERELQIQQQQQALAQAKVQAQQEQQQQQQQQVKARKRDDGDAYYNDRVEEDEEEEEDDDSSSSLGGGEDGASWPMPPTFK